ncbi:CPBP family intramembrane glutamic endopeptidase [Palleronia sp. LCG004]|uniref:CPBP family intramembrane glutamic endopeptidase n=1 Tax=Palleronia sp. LCG004 TaxID=3079304 RepID=UPI002943CA14|nr:CPBP family intramembrane glutamic endopeptidase [Palleronia sp. LCG004]WOI58293.1 CPBP family intramembrane glutamic endopeptidase [Palleronia sp. LCG004]
MREAPRFLLKRRRNLPRDNRIGWALVTLALWTAITFGGAELFVSDDQSLDAFVTRGILWQIVCAGMMLVAVIAWRGWNDLGFRAPIPGTLKLLWLPILLVALQFTFALLLGLPDSATILLIFVNTLFVGFSEETMFRGVLYRALCERLRIWPAILVTSSVFGAVHVLNGFITGEFESAIYQAIMAGSTGLLLMAIVLRTGSLWAAIAWHAAWDAALLLIAEGMPDPDASNGSELANSGGWTTILIPLALVLPNLLYALWLLRHVHHVPAPANAKAE